VFLPFPGSKKDEAFSESLQAFAVSVEVTRVFYGEHFVTRHCSSNKCSMYTRNAHNLEWFVCKVCSKLSAVQCFLVHTSQLPMIRERTRRVQMASNFSHTVMFGTRLFSVTHFSAVFPQIHVAHVFTTLVSRSGESGYVRLSLSRSMAQPYTCTLYIGPKPLMKTKPVYISLNVLSENFPDVERYRQHCVYYMYM